MKTLRFRPQPWHLAAFIVLVCAGVISVISMLRSRGIDTPAEMIACLPHKGATLAYVNVSALRGSGLLDLIAGSKAAEEIEYRAFVDGAGFDYRRDLDRLALAISGNNVWFVLRGRFDWGKLNSYTTSHGGVCRNSVCTVETSMKRWVSYYPLRAGAMALAMSAHEGAVFGIKPDQAPTDDLNLPSQPIWISVPAATLRDAESLPSGARSFVRPLSSAEKIVFAIGPQANGLQLSADVTCSSEAAASELLVELERATTMLRKMLEREKQEPNPRDLSGILVSGSFSRQNRHVLGRWPVAREFVQTVAGEDLN